LFAFCFALHASMPTSFCTCLHYPAPVYCTPDLRHSFLHCASPRLLLVAGWAAVGRNIFADAYVAGWQPFGADRQTARLLAALVWFIFPRLVQQVQLQFRIPFPHFLRWFSSYRLHSHTFVATFCTLPGFTFGSVHCVHLRSGRLVCVYQVWFLFIWFCASLVYLLRSFITFRFFAPFWVPSHTVLAYLVSTISRVRSGVSFALCS